MTSTSRWPRPTRTSSSTRAVRRDRPRGPCSRIGPTCCARCPAPSSNRAEPMVCPYPLFHMGAWTIALQQWQARDTVVFVALGHGRGDRGRGRAPSGHPAQLRPRRLATTARRTALGPGRARPVVDPLRRHRHVGHTARAAAGHRRCAARRAGARLLRVDRGRGRHRPRARRHRGASRAAAGCPGRSPRSASTTTVDCGSAGPLLFDGYLDDLAATRRGAGRRLVRHRRSGRRRRRRLSHDRGSRPAT